MIRKIENISKQIEDQIQIKELEVSNITEIPVRL